MRVFVKPIHGGKHVPYKTGDRSIDATIEDLAEVKWPQREHSKLARCHPAEGAVHQQQKKLRLGSCQ
jgi:hypothetical protein